MTRRSGLLVGGLLLAFLLGLLVSKPPMSSAALHEGYAYRSR